MNGFSLVLTKDPLEDIMFVPTDKQRLSSIHEAVRYGDVLELQAMVQRGAGINDVDSKFKFTPLHWAAHHGTLEVSSAHKLKKRTTSRLLIMY